MVGLGVGLVGVTFKTLGCHRFTHLLIPDHLLTIVESLAFYALLCVYVCEHSFSGAFHCPPAVEFCRFETVSGVRYPEFVPWQLYLLLVLFPGLPIAVTLFCLFPCRDVCVMPAKRW